MGYNGGVHKKLWIYIVVLGYNIFYNFNSRINNKQYINLKMKTYQEVKNKTPSESLYIEVIKKAFADAFAVGAGTDPNQALSESQAKSWFSLSNKDFKLICEHAGTEAEYILKLYHNMQYNYNSGKITKEEVKFGISRLDLKI